MLKRSGTRQVVVLPLDRGGERAYMPRAMTIIATMSALRRRRPIRAAVAVDRM